MLAIRTRDWVLSLQLVRQGFEAISQMGHPEGDGTAAGAAGVADGSGGGEAVVGPKLVVRLEAVTAIVQQAKALFQVVEEDGSGPTPGAAAAARAAAVIPLARREGGIIGGPDTLSSPYGNAVVWPAAAGSDQPSLLFVSSYGHNCVRVFDAISGASIRQIATGANPWGLALRSPGPVDRAGLPYFMLLNIAPTASRPSKPTRGPTCASSARAWRELQRTS